MLNLFISAKQNKVQEICHLSTKKLTKVCVRKYVPGVPKKNYTLFDFM